MVEEQLAGRGIRDARVLWALGRVPREQFVAPTHPERAYDDGALPIACGQTISQPYMVARMTELLAVDNADRVLEIGTGSGYQAAVLAQLAAHVYTIERHEPLLIEATARFAALGLTNITSQLGDGTLGWPAEAPFDAIMVTAGAPRVPTALPAQLADGGRLVIPVGAAHEQTLVVVRRHGDTFAHEQSLPCRFVKLRGAAGWPEHD